MKKKIALAAILAVTITLTGCELPFEIKMKGSDSETSSSTTSSVKKDEDSKPSSNPEESKTESSDNSTADVSKPESPVNSTPEASKPESKPNYDEIDFEPVVQTVGDIVERGGSKYFEASTRYGNACTVVYRYIFDNDLFSDCECRVEPGALTELEQIINDNWYRVGDIGAYEVSDFTKFANTWVLTKEGWNDEAKSFFGGAEINMLHSLLKLQAG